MEFSLPVKLHPLSRLRYQTAAMVKTDRLQSRADILAMIRSDYWMMACLGAVRALGLPDSWIGAGFLRARVWDYQHGFETATPLEDVDVIFFDPRDLSVEREKQLERRLREARSDVNWSVKNQARMHQRNEDPPYRSASHAMEYWLETPTAVAVRLDGEGQLQLAAPFGLDDLLHLVVRPTPKACSTAARRREYNERMDRKQLAGKWPLVRIIRPENQ